MKQLIRVYEHEVLKVDEKFFKYEHLTLLSEFLGNKGEDVFPYYSLIHNGVKFKHYVGVISIGNLQIEILPKADKSAGEEEKDVWENHLLEMLRVVNKIKINLPSKAEQRMKYSHVLDVLLNHFMDEVEHILHIGLVKTYRRVENNCTSLRGRLMMSKHITKNMVHKEHFYIDYTSYDRNHICNRLLYKALRVIPEISADSYTIHKAKTLAFEFPELDDVVVSEALFNKLVFDRKTEDYRNSIDLAGMILLNYMPNMTYRHGKNVIALMFDMNKLWEEYVYRVIRRQLPNHTVLPQARKMFWESDVVGGKIVKPDIVIMKDNKCIAVLDTKWKIPADGKPGDSDLKQMFVYHEYWNTERIALIYPGNGTNVEGHFVKDGKDIADCRMYYLPISSTTGSKLLETKVLLDYLEECGERV